MSTPESALSRRAEDNAAPGSPGSVAWHWLGLGPAAVLVVGIASFAWANTQKLPPATFPPLCGLAASAPSGEAPFLAENDTAMTKMMANMAVQPTGDVDHDFAEMMVPHHQGAIDMAQALLRYGHNEALRRLAQEIIVTQQQEITAMRLALGEPLPPPVSSPTQSGRSR
jgi:DUF305 family protein family protein